VLCLLAILILSILIISVGGKDASAYFNILLKKSRIFDGSLRPPFEADVTKKDSKIIQIAPSIHSEAMRVIDAKDLWIIEPDKIVRDFL